MSTCPDVDVAGFVIPGFDTEPLFAYRRCRTSCLSCESCTG